MTGGSPPLILFVTGRLRTGGTEIALYRTALGLHARGRYQPRVTLLAEGGAMGERLRQAGVPVDDLKIGGRLYGPAGLLCFARLCGLTRRLRPRIVHTFLFDADVVGPLAARAAGARAITTRRAIKSNKRAQLAAYRWSNGLAARIVANSEEVRRFTLRAEGVAPDKVRVIPNGIETGGFATGDGGRFRSNLGISPTALVVGSLGTVKPVKGQDSLFQALLPVLRERDDLVVLVAGSADTPLGEELRTRARAEGVSARFVLLGDRDDVPDFLASLDVFVLPSRSEGMSNALLEAMASGRPIVATRVGGNAEALAGGAAGLLVPPENPDALRSAVRSLLDDLPLRRRLAAAARTRATAEYDLSIMLERTEQLYSEVLSAR